MKTQDQVQGSLTNILSWIAILVLTGLAFFCTYYYSFSAPIKSIMWVLWFVSVLLLGYFTEQGRQVFYFAQEAKVELIKVVWPTRQETIQTTTIVMAVVALTGFVLWALDSGMMWIIGKITHLG